MTRVLFGFLLFAVLFFLPYLVVLGSRLLSRAATWQPQRLALVSLLLCGVVCAADCAALGSGVCANLPTATTPTTPTASTAPATASTAPATASTSTAASATNTPQTPSAGTIAGIVVDCAAPGIEQLASALLPQLVQKLEGGAPSFLSDLTALEGYTPAAVACATQDLLQASCAPASSTAPAPAPAAVASVAPSAPASISTTPSSFATVQPAVASAAISPETASSTATRSTKPKLPRLSAAAQQRALKYLKSRGFRFVKS